MVGFGQNGCLSAKVVVLGQSRCIGQKWLYSCKAVVFWQGLVIFGQNCCIRAKVVVFGQSSRVWAKMVVFGENLLYSG